MSDCEGCSCFYVCPDRWGYRAGYCVHELSPKRSLISPGGVPLWCPLHADVRIDDANKGEIMKTQIEEEKP